MNSDDQCVLSGITLFEHLFGSKINGFYIRDFHVLTRTTPTAPRAHLLLSGGTRGNFSTCVSAFFENSRFGGLPPNSNWSSENELSISATVRVSSARIVRRSQRIKVKSPSPQDAFHIRAYVSGCRTARFDLCGTITPIRPCEGGAPASCIVMRANNRGIPRTLGSGNV